MISIRFRTTLVVIIAILLFDTSDCSKTPSRSWLEDAFLPVYRSLRLGLNRVLRHPIYSESNQNLLKTLHKYYAPVSDSREFPCKLVTPLRSKKVPQNAHEVRPGDIDVVGAIGDSLSAGIGVSASDILQLLTDDRGKSFTGGGQGTWRTVLTLPNILKVFNPNLIGYSDRPSLTIEKNSNFNVAEAGAVSVDVPYMVKVLIKRMKSDTRVDVNHHWKMITFMIGANDFCVELCDTNDAYGLLEEHRKHLVYALRLLRDNLPRTLVVVIPPPYVRPIMEFKDKPPICHVTHSALCPCLAGLAYRHRTKLYNDVMRKWQLLDIKVANEPEFDRDDFTVIPLNTTLDYTFPTHPDGSTDFGYLSVDCFHFSSRGHARFANDIWNSIMEPFGNKSLDGTDVFSKFHCPTEEHPYIFTRRNSGC